MNSPSHRLLDDQAILDILALAPDATAIYTGEDVVIEMANDKMIGFWGKDRSIIGLPLVIAVPELKGQQFIPILSNVWRTGITYEAFRTPAELNIDGNIKTYYFDFVYRAIKNADGSMRCILHTATDVSHQVLSERKLKAQEDVNVELNRQVISYNNKLTEVYVKLAESEGLFRNIFEQAPIGLTWLSGPDMIIEQVNAPMLKIWGRDADSVLGKPIAQARPELQGQSVLGMLDEVYQTGRNKINTDFKVYLLNGDGLREAYVNSVYTPVKDHAGTVKGILVVVNEVTEHFVERQKRSLMEEQFRISVESAELGTWYVDASTRAFITSARLRELFGFYPEDEITLDDAISQIRVDYREIVAAAIDAAIENETSYDIEYPVIGYHDQKLRWIRATGKLYPAEHGMKPHFSGVVTEITDRKTEDRRKYDFIAIVSHELKTPLTSLKAYLQILLSDIKHDAGFVYSALKNMERQVEKMHSLIKGFLDVARLETSEIKLDREDFKISELLHENVAEAGLFAKRHELVVDADDDIIIDADREKIGQVITNFLSNAIKYSPGGGKIILHCSKEEDQVGIYVTDSGIGISTQDKARLFSRFYRVDSQHTKTISGFGIGLYLCAEIIRLHNGTIGVESEIGKGSTFYFKIPL